MEVILFDDVFFFLDIEYCFMFRVIFVFLLFGEVGYVSSI